MTDAASSPEAQFWSFVSRGELRFPRCRACGTWRYPPTEICHRCLSPRTAWEEASGRAELLSFVTVHRGPDEHRSFPYLVLHGELEEGITYTANAIGDVTRADMRIGMPLRLALVGEGAAALPQFVFPPGGPAGEGESTTDRRRSVPQKTGGMHVD